MSIYSPDAGPDAAGDGRRWPQAVRIGAAIVALLAGVGVITRIVSPSGGQTGGTTASVPPVQTPHSAPRVQTPQVDEGSLHPYELLRNPYAHRNHIISMDVASWPILYNGQLMQYVTAPNSAGVRLGYSGMRLNRMLSEKTALYDVMGHGATGGPELEILGQLAVQVPSGAELDVQRLWDIEPFGTLEGNNGFGAQIQVPQVRFWRYSDERSRVSQDSSGDRLAAVNLVKGRVSPTKSLTSMQPDFNSVKWEAVNQSDICSSCWYVVFWVKVSAPERDSYESGAWSVNLSTQTVVPANDTTLRLFRLFQTAR